MAAWELDDWIEYLLACDRGLCTSVIQRITADPDRSSLCGLPELWSAALSAMVSDERLAGIQVAMRRAFEEEVADEQVRAAARLWCFTLTCYPNRQSRLIDIELCEGISERAASLLRQTAPQAWLASDHLAMCLRTNEADSILTKRMPETLLRDAARLVQADGGVLARLERYLASDLGLRDSMAVSLLCAIDQKWRPRSRRAPRLYGAYLSGVQWNKIRLSLLDLRKADLHGADFTGCRLRKVQAAQSNWSAARLRGARLHKFSASESVFASADLSNAKAPRARLDQCDFRNTRLDGATFRWSNFQAADFRGARCCKADLFMCDLLGAQIEDADFSGANLSGASLKGAVLRRAEFRDAQFTFSNLSGCDLEGMRLPGANFFRASLERASLTGSWIPGGNFRRAILSLARLAEIDWEAADLRNANLQGVTFHLGSSRSGLVGSPIASEGTRTGFYTDDYDEQGFKSPEEIRKANLRGADLRGANIDGVDFYLVDLRDARYTPKQEAIFRSCRAILETRV
jgi:uncharacterized protein YjbI with pentapeptide repeats